MQLQTLFTLQLDVLNEELDKIITAVENKQYVEYNGVNTQKTKIKSMRSKINQIIKFPQPILTNI